MEISKLTICRQDVIIVSDTNSESNKNSSNKKKKRKRKTKCIRNVKLTTVAVNRIIPYCHRQRCRRGHHYHTQTSTNTKYRNRRAPPIQMKYIETPIKDTLHKSDENDIKIEVRRELYSPITVASSSDTYENVSSCSFNVVSSDSDELEDLINLTRKRMKNDEGHFNSYPVRKYARSIAQDDYQNISSNDEVLDTSIHSMDTVVLYHGDPISRSGSPEHVNRFHLKQHNNNNTDPVLLCRNRNMETNQLLQQKIPSLTNQNNNNLSPMYEISGKVFMEHYLNTSFI